MIELVTSASSDQAVHILMRAFHDDPEMVHFVHDPAHREKLITALFGIIVRHAVKRGSAYMLDGKAAAVWIMPGDSGVSIGEGLRPSLVRMIGQVGVGWIPRVISFMFKIEAMQRQTVRGTHIYLTLLGVDPDFQSQGLGRKLMTPMLERADREGLPIYLQTFTERAVRFYETHGFRIAAEFNIPMGGPMGWSMLRD